MGLDEQICLAIACLTTLRRLAEGTLVLQLPEAY
jgi:hypothetical protein